jgi:gas vesicle protein
LTGSNGTWGAWRQGRFAGRFFSVSRLLEALEVGISREGDRQRHNDPKTRERTMRKMTKIRAFLGVLAVVLLVVSAAGCGTASDQTKQEAKNKFEDKATQAKQEVKQKTEDKKQQAKKKVEDKGKKPKQEIEKKVDDLKKKVETGQEDLKKKVDAVQKDVNDLQKKMDELLKKLDAKNKRNQ